MEESNRPPIFALPSPDRSAKHRRTRKTKPQSSGNPNPDDLPRTVKRKHQASDTGGLEHEGLLVDILKIHSGEEVGERILSYFRDKSKTWDSSPGKAWAGIIMSATGSVLNPTIQAKYVKSSYEGRFTILRLSATFVISEDGEVQQQGQFTLYCATPDHYVFGGTVEGPLTAATPMQVVLSSCVCVAKADAGEAKADVGEAKADAGGAKADAGKAIADG